MSDVDTDAPLTSEPIELIESTIFSEQAGTLHNEPMPDIAGNYLPLKDFYGVGDLDQETQSRLQTVWEHFAKDAKTPSTVLKKIRVEHLGMMEPNLGDSKLNQMWNYVKILESFEEAKSMKEAFKK